MGAVVAGLAGSLLVESAGAAPPDLDADRGTDAQVAWLEQQREESLEQLRRESLPPPMEAGSLRSWAERLGFDAEGLELLDAIVQRYERESARIEAEAAAGVRQRLEASYRFDDSARRFEPVATPEYLGLIAARETLFAQFERIDAALFREFEALAAPERRALLGRMRSERAQEVYRRSDRLPGASLDLAALVESLEIDPAEHAGAVASIDRYRQAQSEALRDRHRAGRAFDREHAELLLELGPGWEVILDEAAREAAAEQLRQIELAFLDLDRPLRSLHRETLMRLRQQLPAEPGRRLQEAYQQRTYPELFRDDRRLSETLASPALAEVLDEAARRSVEESLDRALREVQRGSFLMMELADALGSVEALPTPAARLEAAMLLEVRMLELQQSRRDRLGRVLRETRALLPPGSEAAGRALSEALAVDESLGRATAYRRTTLVERAQLLRALAEQGG
jgi:hypothetical protein